MNIYAISDLHLSFSCDKPMDIFGGEWADYLDKIKEDWQQKVQEDDIVLLAGDLSWAMNLNEVKADLSFLSSLKGKKVLIKGNHDYWWSSLSKLKEILPEGIYVLQNDALRFENVIVCGTRGWVTAETGRELPPDDKKIYLREIERLKLSFAKMNSMRKVDDKVIVMMHYPPFNSRRENNEMTALISENRIDSVVYGHLHGKDCRADLVTVKEGIPYHLTSCDQLKNKLLHLFSV